MNAPVDMGTRATAMLRVNGEEHAVKIDPLASLAAVLREQFGLTGTKISCNAGDCGACTVLVNGKPVMGCQTLAARVQGEVTTVEGLHGPVADALRAAFIEEGAFQCGYCTSGQIVSCHGLVDRSDTLSDAELAVLLSGNICRCTGYAGIIRAVRAAARAVRATTEKTI